MAEVVAGARPNPAASSHVAYGPAARSRPDLESRRDRTSFSPVAFLSGQGVAPGALLTAEAEAQRVGIGADEALIASGAIGEAAFYRALARHLRVPFVEEPRFASDTPLAAVRAGVARLHADTADGRPIYAMAPRGYGIVALSRVLRAPSGGGGDVVIVAPSTLSSALRALRAREVVAEASASVAPELSARGRVSPAQSATFAVLIALCMATLAPIGPLGDLATIALGLVFAVALVIRLAATTSALDADALAPPAPALGDADLPRYSVVVALYREARVARDLVAALDALDYPRAKLDIKLVIEQDDRETRAALEALDLPARYEIIVAPNGAPRTKPRALNVALPLVAGEYVTVYDAEDRPERDQLRKAAARFAVASSRVACLQAKLAIDNDADGPLPRLFAIEYAALFDALNPGLAALGLPIPLGGTSNHFRARELRSIGGWDAWNVTEDADLGLRLAREGLAVETLDSTTWEEAPITLTAWLAQRGRWLKGWMQTLAVHSRAPRKAVAAFGPLNAIAAAATIGGALASALFLPFFTLRVGVDLWHGALLRAETPLAWAASSVSLAVLVFGPLAALAPALVGLRRRGSMRMAALLPALPVYYLLVSIAAWRALFEAWAQPYRWAKTEHGISRRRMSAPAA